MHERSIASFVPIKEQRSRADDAGILPNPPFGRIFIPVPESGIRHVAQTGAADRIFPYIQFPAAYDALSGEQKIGQCVPSGTNPTFHTDKNSKIQNTFLLLHRMLDLLEIRFVDVLDVLLVGLLIYGLFRALRGTSALNIFLVILALYIAWIIFKALDMRLISFVLGQVLGGGVIVILIIFQQDVRRFLLNIGNRITPVLKHSFLGRILRTGHKDAISFAALEEITAACKLMSEKKTGALIVLTHENSLTDYIETGDEVDAVISRRMIESIFFKNAPLHDGAVIMSQSRIIAARCTLPMSDNPNLPAHYGMRHKAALGISEVSDAFVVVVSEETGETWIADNGRYKTISSITELRRAIEDSYK